MKRFTLLTMLVALFSVTAFAQKGMKKLPFNGELPARPTAFQGVARQAQPVTNVGRRAGVELVTPPATATVETWYTVGGKFYVYTSEGRQNGIKLMPTVNVAIDGSDIYIQGLAYWFKTGWIKGTVNGTTATFACGQFVGEDEYGPEYLVGSDDGATLSENIVFSYDATEGILKAVTQFIFENGSTTTLDIYSYWIEPTFSKTEPVKPEVVVLPEGVSVEEFVMFYQDEKGVSQAKPAKVAVDGNDVYFQCISYYLPEAWVKGTKDGNTVTFPKMQYMGFFDDFGDDGDVYAFYGADAVFTYDAEAGAYAAEGEIYGIVASDYYDGRYFNPVLKKVVDKGATPANPSITELRKVFDGGTVMFFKVPVVDTDGNGMAVSKLGIQFFVDVEKEVSPLTFKAEYYQNLDADMTVFPYGFVDGIEFYDNMFFLNMPEYRTFNKIGIQSIYTGGGEEHKSEIVWFTIKEYGDVKFDFNAMDVACSSSTSDAGDITSDLTLAAGNVTLTVSPSTSSTPNRFWSTNNGPQLRVYGGTLTFKVPANKVITKIVFNNGKWNAGNSAEPGVLEANVWTGEANKVVMTIAGNTQLNSIDVETREYVPTPVVAPEGLVTDSYTFRAMENINIAAPARRAMRAYSYRTEVGFDGNDVYIKGLSENTADLWIKATKNEAGQYVIPANQYLGRLNYYGMYVYDFYIAAFDEELNAMDIVLDFDAEKNKFTTDQVVALHKALENYMPYQVFTEVSLTKYIEVAATPADPTVEKLRFNAPYSSARFTIPVVGTNGEELDEEKLFYTVWIEKNGEQQPYTFTASAYCDDFDEDVTEVPYTYDGYDFYFGGQVVYFEESAEELSTWSRVGIQSIYYGAGEVHKSNIAWVYNDIYVPTEITVDEVGYATFYDANHSFEIPEGVKAYVVTAATTERLTYSELEGVIPAGTAVMLEATGGTYPLVVAEESVTYDGVNLLYGSNLPTMTTADVEDCLFYKLAYGHSGTLNANKVGWYWGAENGAAFEIEPHRAWLAIPPVLASAPGYPIGGTTGISNTVARESDNAVFYDLQGRRVATPVKGLYIQKNKKVIIK